jgi:cyclopropane fatty-acyl-phospholipid synthase-like methyltransferase
MAEPTAAALMVNISPDERMPADDVAGYLAVGESALHAIRLAQRAAGADTFTSILDFPSGHGRVLRWLKAAFPDARLTACDVLPDAVDWCARQLGATGVLSSQEPSRSMFAERYDLIWSGSLLTHVDVPMWRRLIDLWCELLTDNGLLVITTHGEFVAKRMAAGHLYGFPALQVKRLLRAYEHSGFGFLEESPTSVDYGITLSGPDWVLHEILRHRDLRVVLATEMLWDHHQDVFAFKRSPLHVSGP